MVLADLGIEVLSDTFRTHFLIAQTSNRGPVRVQAIDLLYRRIS